MEKKKFYLKINGQEVLDLEFGGSEDMVAPFMEQVVKDTFGIFRNWKDAVGKMILDGMEVRMSVVFRDKNGKFVKPKVALVEDNTPL